MGRWSDHRGARPDAVRRRAGEIKPVVPVVAGAARRGGRVLLRGSNGSIDSTVSCARAALYPRRRRPTGVSGGAAASSGNAPPPEHYRCCCRPCATCDADCSARSLYFCPRCLDRRRCPVAAAQASASTASRATIGCVTLSDPRRVCRAVQPLPPSLIHHHSPYMTTALLWKGMG